MTRREELCVTTRLTSLEEIAAFIHSQAIAAGLDDEQAYAVQTAVDEACTNVIEHAYDGDSGGEIRVCCWEEGRELVVRITDLGRPFDPTAVPEPDVTAPLEERDLGGLGIYLMRRLMDSVSFRSTESEGNELVMRKRRTGD